MTKDEKKDLLVITTALYNSLLVIRGDQLGNFASLSIETEFRKEVALTILHLNNVRYLISSEVPSDE